MQMRFQIIKQIAIFRVLTQPFNFSIDVTWPFVIFGSFLLCTILIHPRFLHGGYDAL